MSRSVEQTRAVPKEVLPPRGRVNWWGLLGLFCVIASAVLSVTIIGEVLEFLKTSGMLELVPAFG